MRIETSSPEEYIRKLPDDRKEPFSKLRQTLLKNLPEGFVEMMSYGMIGYVVPHSEYQKGYHADPELPLPFIAIASQKNHIAFYHMGIYADEKLLNWFRDEYPKHSKSRLDCGKSCIRFKNARDIPYDLIGDLAGKMSMKDWITIYERSIKRR